MRARAGAGACMGVHAQGGLRVFVIYIRTGECTSNPCTIEGACAGFGAFLTASYAILYSNSDFILLDCGVKAFGDACRQYDVGSTRLSAQIGSRPATRERERERERERDGGRGNDGVPHPSSQRRMSTATSVFSSCNQKKSYVRQRVGCALGAPHPSSTAFAERMPYCFV